MTCLKIQKPEFFVFFLSFLLVQSGICDGRLNQVRDTSVVTSAGKNVEGTVKKDSAHDSRSEQNSDQSGAVLSGGTTIITDGNKTVEDITSKSSLDTNKTAPVLGPQKEPHLSEGHGNPINPGAVLRGLYVFVGLSVLVMAYIVFRSFRLSKTRAQMVRKYGVLAHRQDVEMRPLPLEEEDDEDTTVFDASNVLTNNVQHQNL